MEIISFNRLDEKKRDELFAFMCGLVPAKPFASAEDMVKDLTHPPFHQGENFLTFWKQSSVTGTIAVITQEAKDKGEIFMTYLFASPEHSFLIPEFIRAAEQLAVTREGVTAKTVAHLGVREEMSYLAPGVKNAGYAETTRIWEMRREAVPWEHAGSALEFAPLTPQHLDDFVSIHNAAFLKSPNGGQTSVAEARQALEQASCPDLLQVGFLRGKPAVMFDLQIREGNGWIEALAVKPDLQGRGLGREALNHAISTLVSHGTRDIRLTVVEANTAALNLYKKAGFVPGRVISTRFTRCCDKK